MSRYIKNCHGTTPTHKQFPENLKSRGSSPVSGRALYVVENGVVTVICRGDVDALRGRAFLRARGAR